MQAGVRSFSNLRRYIGGALFLSTVINYIGRQTLSVISDRYSFRPVALVASIIPLLATVLVPALIRRVASVEPRIVGSA